jgi:hypothetical protein
MKGYSFLTDGNWTIFRETPNKSDAEPTMIIENKRAGNLRQPFEMPFTTKQSLD